MEETQGGKLRRKMEEMPFFPIGIAGFLIAAGFGAYNFKNRGKMSPSIYLMQLRVAAQGTVVGCLALGVMYTMYKDYFQKHENKSK